MKIRTGHSVISKRLQDQSHLNKEDKIKQKNESENKDPSGCKIVARRSMLLSCPFDQYRSGDRRRGHDRPKAKPVNIPTVPGSKQLRLKKYGSSSCILETSNKSDPSALSGSDEMTSSNVSLNYSSSENFYELEQDVSHDSIYATPTRFIPVSSHRKQRKIRNHSWKLNEYPYICKWNTKPKLCFGVIY